jgi:glyoxylase-like metal-dependent hydrolase (beta-lactamase superfamily II)
MSPFRWPAAAALSFVLASAALAQSNDPPDRVISTLVAGQVHMLSGGGGANISVLVGRGRALLVDSKGPAVTAQIVAIVNGLSGGEVEYLVNGHVHPDHTDGNANFAERGATIIAHAQVREILAAGQRGGPPAPRAAWPVLTFPDGGGVSVYFDGEPVHITHAPPAHSHDNSIVFFERSNVLHLGDLYSTSRYPVIAGGTIDGFVAAADIALALADRNTKIVPGIGAVSDRQGLSVYRDMLATVRERVAQGIADGKSLDEVTASQPTRGFDQTWDAPDHPLFLPVIYTQLSAR